MPPKKTPARTARITATRKTLVSPPPVTVLDDTIDVDADIIPNSAPGPHTVPSVAPVTPTSPLVDDSTAMTWRKMPRDHPDALGKGWFPFLQRSTELVVQDFPFQRM